ncbi:MAG: TIGR04086 family membrane protein [Acutalibacteraceae bacterium]|nr:TIGR04086 family membrane protein [Acutalibacteraceae bacterium]
MKNKSSITPSPFEVWLKPILTGAILGITVTLCLFVLLALIMSFSILPTNSASVVASIAIAAGSFFGGFSAAKKLGKNGLVIGAICGFLLFIILTLIGVAAFKSAPGTSTVIRLLIFVVSGAIGGIIGVSGNDKRKIV